MLGLIVCAAALATNPPAPGPGSYAEARGQAGRSADDQVRLALWCEAHGMAAERLHHLALAVLADPSHAAARGLMGLVAHEGRWRRPEAVADGLGADPALIEYDARRQKAPDTAEGHRALGVWAVEHGLADQGRAHLAASVRLDPDQPDARKRLGYLRRGGRWLTEAQVAAEKAEAEAQRQADRRWKPVLEEFRRLLAYPARRAEAEAGLADVTDPRAVPSIGRVFATVEDQQPRAARLLGQVDAPSASRALAFLAVFARSAEARRASAETLRRRDPREYAEVVIARLRDPIRYEVRHPGGPGTPGELLVEGEAINVRRLYQPPPVLGAGDRLGRDDSGRLVVVRPVEPTSGSIDLSDFRPAMEPPISGMSRDEVRLALPIVGDSLAVNPARPNTKFTFTFGATARIPIDAIRSEARRSLAAADRQLRDDVGRLEDHNVAVRIANERAAGVLNDATGRSLPADRGAWSRWWVDQVGYASTAPDWRAKSETVEVVPVDYRPPSLPDEAVRDVVGYSRRSCFAAGTPVRTIAGPRQIESLRVGDRVLTQSTATGALGYRPILAVHRNPPSPTFRIDLAGGPIVSSHFHRFWVAGRGWVMARDLSPGDPVRTLGGVSPVGAIESDAVQPVFNFDVADDADFFAGPAGALVHDNTLPDPRLAPFDAPKAVAIAR